VNYVRLSTGQAVLGMGINDLLARGVVGRRQRPLTSLYQNDPAMLMYVLFRRH